MVTFILLEVLYVILLPLCACSIIEHLVHRFWMHAPKKPFVGAFMRHTEHHKQRRSLVSYHREDDHKEVSQMPYLLLLQIPICATTGLLWRWDFAIGFVINSLLYVWLYEQFHDAMHANGEHWLHRRLWFRFMSEYHRIHHRWPRTNFCVVCPIGDLFAFRFSLRKIEEEKKTPPRLRGFTGPWSVILQAFRPRSGSYA